MTEPAEPLATGRGARATDLSAPVVLLCLVLAALNLRATVAVVPPLAETIAADLGLSNAAVGLLTALPVLCMGAFAPLAQRIAVRRGRDEVVLIAMALVAAGSLLRAAGSGVELVYAGTLATGVGIAAGSTVLPGVVKQHFARRAGSATGVYVFSMTIGATLASAVSVPTARALGSWQQSVGLWGLPALLAAVAWAWVVVRSRRPRAFPPTRPVPVGPAVRHGLPWRSRTAWALTGFVAVSATQFYSQLAWLAPFYEAHGWSPAGAGLLLALFNVAGLAGGLLAPVLSDRIGDRRWLTVPAALAVAACLAGLLVAPLAAPLVWMAGLGVGGGVMFALGLVMLVDYGATPAGSARLAAMVFLLAYLFAAAGPYVVGALRDATGEFTIAIAFLLALMVVQVGTALRLHPRRVQVA